MIIVCKGGDFMFETVILIVFVFSILWMIKFAYDEFSFREDAKKDL